MTDDDDLRASLREFRKARRRGRIKLLGAVVAFVGLLGLLPVPLGLGVFGWRLFRYDRVQLHFVNIEGETVRLEVGGVSDAFPGGRVHSLAFRAGEVELRAFGEDGRQIDAIAFETDNQSVFYNLGEGHCFGLFEASSLYDQGRSGPPIRLERPIWPQDRITPIPRGIFIPPRGVAPDSVPGGQRVWWIDDVACQLLDPDEENVLIAQQVVRMEGRRAERRRRLEETRGAGERE